MFKYVKHLNYPVNIKKKDLRMAKLLLTQLGGANGELAASLRYFCQKFSMPDDVGRALLNDIATEELGHCEMISSMIYQLVKGATTEEIKEFGLESMFTEHGKGIYPADSFGKLLILQLQAMFWQIYLRIWRLSKRLELRMRILFR